MAAPRPPPSKPLDLEITIVSAKHLKNVNWRHGGDLKPYTIFYLDSDRRLATKSDDSGNTRPVWNEHFLIPFTSSPADATLTLEIFHSKPLDTPKPLVGTLRLPIRHLVDPDDANKLRNFELRRPSGRPQGKIRLKLAIRERPGQDYYYSRDYRGYSAVVPPPPPPAAPSPPPPSHPYTYGSYADPYSNYYPVYFTNMPPPPPRPFIDRQTSFGSSPSAPVDYAQYDHRARSGNVGLGTGLAVGALAGAVGGIALEEGLKYEEEKIAERVERDMAARDDYRNYRDEY